MEIQPSESANAEFRLVYANECPRCGADTFYTMGDVACDACTGTYRTGAVLEYRGITYTVLETTAKSLGEWYGEHQDECPCCGRLTEDAAWEHRALSTDDDDDYASECDCCYEDYTAYLEGRAAEECLLQHERVLPTGTRIAHTTVLTHGLLRRYARLITVPRA